LYDLHGNVCEWVNDGYGPYDMATTNNPRGASSGPCPVLRGGSWMHAARGVRSARRINLSVENTPGNCIGFRCVRTSHKNIPLVTQGLANEIAFRSLMKDYAPQLLVAKYSLTTNELVYPSALLKKGFIWQCGSCGTINDVTSYRPGEATMCQCGQGAIITGVKACNIATCPACGVKHNVAKATQGLFTCRNKECDTAFLVADQSTRLAAAQRKHLPQFVAIAQDAIALRTKAIIAVMRMDSNEQCSKQLSDYIAAQMLGALNDESTRTPREIEVVDRTAIKTVMNELELQKIYGEPETRKQISQQLNADVLLASDIKVADDVLVLTVKVVDVENGKLLLTKTTEIPITPRLRDLNKK
jgi:TolB-like protein